MLSYGDSTVKLSDIATILNKEVTHPSTEIQQVTSDSRTLQPGALFVALKGDHYDGHDFIAEAEDKGAACILASQPVNAKCPVILVEDTLKALTQLASGYRQHFHFPVIGLTGSCGKTTTKSLIAKIFETQGATLATQGTLNNHIGVPLTLMALRPTHQYAVIEMGANHPGEIAQLTKIVRPSTALITNIAPVHLEGFGSLEGVSRAKAEIFQGLEKSGNAVINADDPYAEYFQRFNAGKTIITFGSQSSAQITAHSIQLNEESLANFLLVTPTGEIPIQLKLIGEHQVMNALAAAACAYAHHVPLESIQFGLESLEEVNRRLCHYQTPEGAHIIDDSYNANPTATLAALNVLKAAKGKRIFVFADMLELGTEAIDYHKKIGTAAKAMGIEKLYTYGDLAKFAAQTFGDGGFHFSNQQTLLSALTHEIHPNTTLLVKGSNSMKMREVVEALIRDPHSSKY